jgi:hypothetical protein
MQGGADRGRLFRAAKDVALFGSRLRTIYLDDNGELPSNQVPELECRAPF